MFPNVVIVELAECVREFDEDDFPANLAPLPALPTTAAPGTEEKIRIMAERYARREQLTHPYDATDAADDSPRQFAGADTATRAVLLQARALKDTGFSMFFGD